MRLTKKRFEEHCKTMDIIKDNCVHLKDYPDWTLISSRLDEGAFKIVGGTVFLGLTGTDDFFEALNNAKVKANVYGEHTGFAESGLELFYDLIRCLGNEFRYYRYEIDAHSRGVPIAQKIAKKLSLSGVEEPVNLVSTGGAPYLTEDGLEQYKLNKYYTHIMVVTKLDIVPRMQGPKTRIGKWFIGLFGLEPLYHYYTEKVVLPTVHFKFDHISYRDASNKFDWEKYYEKQ